jgi:tripartite-type tricarboxylate transporter receptor subunit TctC
MTLSKLLGALCLVCMVAAAPAAANPASYPDRPVKMIVGFAPGGATDIAARLMAQALSEGLGGSFVVENRPGVGGLVALDLVAKAPADGYTIAVGTVGPLTISPELFKKQRTFETEQQLDPVIRFASTPGVIVVRKDLNVVNVRDLIEVSKKGKGLMMASAGTGSIQHLMGEYFQSQHGVKWTHIPYKGSNPALLDLMAGRADVMLDLGPSAAPYIASEKIKAIALAAPQRSPQLPGVPTMEELGFPGYDLNSWWSLSVPKGTPVEIVRKLNTAINASLKKAETLKQLSGIGAVPVGGTPEELANQIRTDSRRWGAIIRAANVLPD